MEIWVSTLVTKVCDIVLRLLMVVDAQVETLDRVVVSLIGALGHMGHVILGLDRMYIKCARTPSRRVSSKHSVQPLMVLPAELHIGPRFTVTLSLLQPDWSKNS